MPDKVSRFLSKLSAGDRKSVLELLEKAKLQQFTGLNVMPPSGKKGYFRIKKGRVRIIFNIVEGKAKITYIGWRDDQTYRF